MKPILINNSLLCCMMQTLAGRIAAFVTSRHLAVVTPGHPTSDWHYADWRDLQATLRSIPAEWRREALHYLRMDMRKQGRCKAGGFQGWLSRVRAVDAERGSPTQYAPHKPGLFLPRAA